MNQSTTELKNELKKSLGVLQTLRDEVRVKIHLAGMNLKEEWAKLEPRLEDVEKAAGEVSEASRTALSEAIKSLQKLRSSLR